METEIETEIVAATEGEKKEETQGSVPLQHAKVFDVLYLLI